MRVPLRQLAHLRSGDKGNTSNTAVIAYQQALFPYLVEQLTGDAALAFYGGAIAGPVRRYVVERLGVLNFVFQGALGGGVSRTLAIDNYGKALGAALLGFPVEIPDEHEALLRRPDLWRDGARG
jgi:hypothetical protein